jgi:hypothetical protein
MAAPTFDEWIQGKEEFSNDTKKRKAEVYKAYYDQFKNQKPVTIKQKAEAYDNSVLYLRLLIMFLLGCAAGSFFSNFK